MNENKVMGWISIALFFIAISILLFVGMLLIFPTFQAFIHVDAQVLLIASDVFALLAVILGFFSRFTRPGKLGGIGGLVLFIPLSLFLSWILVTSVQTQAVIY